MLAHLEAVASSTGTSRRYRDGGRLRFLEVPSPACVMRDSLLVAEAELDGVVAVCSAVFTSVDRARPGLDHRHGHAAPFSSKICVIPIFLPISPITSWSHSVRVSDSLAIAARCRLASGAARLVRS